ncbi:TIGR03067 domain-containing protein [Stieleria sp. TO1_6]|uniref:TIGR03067 domain-containing protein n=1 Tax=Stieleria tagensis TaxID=2956795 RepID=UPI00209AC1F8|nr:TIGR03067 domain-containing protein [Stieleria tagensis]MCO8123207.1 TIGR03067 domain-containing protein [Stieleria tagensis]
MKNQSLKPLPAFAMSIAFLAATALVPVAATAADDQSKETITQKLQGRWEIISGVNQGRELTEAEVKGTYVTITNNAIATFDRDERQKFRAVFSLDEEKKPIQITMRSAPTEPTTDQDSQVDDQVANATALGIVKLKGDQWVLCYALDQAKRPTEFKSTKQGKTMLFTLEKKKGDPVPDVKAE